MRPSNSASVPLAALMAERARERVEKARLAHPDSPVGAWVTVSAGVGQVNPERDTPETFIDRVDAALYQAKENGRNRVELTDGPQDG